LCYDESDSFMCPGQTVSSVCTWQGQHYPYLCDDPAMGGCWRAHCPWTCGTCITIDDPTSWYTPAWTSTAATLKHSKHSKRSVRSLGEAKGKVHATQQTAGSPRVKANSPDANPNEVFVNGFNAVPSSKWNEHQSIQSCDLTGLGSDATVTNSAGVCADAGAVDDNLDSLIGTWNDEFKRGFGAFYEVEYEVPERQTIKKVQIIGRSDESYNAWYYSQVLGNFDIYIGTRRWSWAVNQTTWEKPDVPDFQTLCKANRKSTATPNWNDMFTCDTPVKGGSWVTIVLRPDESLIGFDAKMLPKQKTLACSPGGHACPGVCENPQTDVLADAGFDLPDPDCTCGCDRDNPTYIAAADSPRFLAIAHMAACAD